MARVIMEHVEYELNVPEPGYSLTVCTLCKLIRKNASDATPASNTAPPGPSMAKPSIRMSSSIRRVASTAGSA